MCRVLSTTGETTWPSCDCFLSALDFQQSRCSGRWCSSAGKCPSPSSASTRTSCDVQVYSLALCTQQTLLVLVSLLTQSFQETLHPSLSPSCECGFCVREKNWKTEGLPLLYWSGVLVGSCCSFYAALQYSMKRNENWNMSASKPTWGALSFAFPPPPLKKTRNPSVTVLQGILQEVV